MLRIVSDDPALHVAVRGGKLEELRRLLESGAPVDERDDLARTALHAVSISGNLEAAKLLLDAGADPNARDAWGLTPLHLAARHAGTTQLLLERGADPLLADDRGWLPHHSAVAGARDAIFARARELPPLPKRAWRAPPPDPERTFAVIACVHGNLEALTAVLEDIERRGVSEIVCLGDLVGYGPDPIECIDLVRARCRVTLRGNHDFALVNGTWGFSAHHARDTVDWARKQLEPGMFARAAGRQRWEFVRELPGRHEDGTMLFVHGSPRDPEHEYLLASDLESGYGIDKYRDAFAAFDRLLFVGHTHQPGLIQEDFEVAAAPPGTWTHDGRRGAIVNVGSVGQPRDGDTRACYATVKGETVTWHRVPYDLERTIEKVERLGVGLPEQFAKRLRAGF